MLCAKATQRNCEEGTGDAMKVEAILRIEMRVVAKNDFSLKAQTSRWRVVGQSLETDQPGDFASATNIWRSHCTLTSEYRSSSASVADVAASIKSSHRLPCAHAAVCGSAERALRSPRLGRRPNSFDLGRSCFGFRADCEMDDLRGRENLSRR